MSRNASGSYALPSGNPVVAHTLATSTWANTTLADLATEMTDSLSRSGKGGMLASLLAVDGTVGAPGLSFSNEPGSGWWRAAAGDVRAAVLGVERVRLGPAASAPLVVTSPAAAGAALADVLFNTTNARTAGSLLEVRNGGVSKFAVAFQGDVVLGGSGYVIASAGNTGLSLLGNKVAADAGVDVLVTSQVTRTAGYLLNVQNNGVSKFLVDFGGGLYHYGTDYAASSDAGLVFVGNKAAGSAGTDHTFSTLAARIAGYLLDVQNNGVSKFSIDFSGGVYVSDTIRQTPANTSLSLRGNRSAGDAGTDVVIFSAATRTAGLLLDVQNNGSSRLTLTPFGDVYITSGDAGSRGLIAGGVHGLVHYGRLAAGSSGPDHALDTINTRTAGLLLDVRNNGASKFSVDFGGNVTIGNDVAYRGKQAGGTTYDLVKVLSDDSVAYYGYVGTTCILAVNGLTYLFASNIGLGAALASGDSTATFTADLTTRDIFLRGANVTATPSNTSLALKGNRSAGDSGADVVVNSAATRTAGLLLDVRNNGTSKFGVGFDGAISGPGIGSPWNLAVKTDADQTESAGTLTNVTSLSFAVEASGVYVWEVICAINQNNSGGGFLVDFTGPASPTSVFYGVPSIGATGVTAAAAFSSTINVMSGVAVDRMCVIYGILVNGANAGTVQARFARTGAGTATFRKGSVLRWRKVA